MWASLQAPLLFGLIAAGVTMLGLFAVTWQAKWAERHAPLFGLAAAGLLLSMALLHLLPEAFAMSSTAHIWLTVGFFAGLVMNLIVRTAFPEKTIGALPRDAITPILAIALHSFIDGLVYTVTFAASFESGVKATTGLILHEFPEGVVAYAIMVRHGVSTRRAFVWAVLAAAATTPLGVLAAGPFVASFDPDLIAILFAISAGLLLYVATGPLLAPLKDTPPARGFIALGTGVVIAIGLMSMEFGSHSHGGHDHHHHAGHHHPH